MMEPGSLFKKRIILGVTGSIAAVETVRLAHALRREGASVTAVMSEAATRIIHPDALTYATGNDAITALSGHVEHVTFCGEGGCADLLLIAPCTANTLCKIARGIDDTPVTTFASTALGAGLPVVVAPAMHESMYRHPGVSECIRCLSSWKVTVIPPRREEGKAKIADIDEIVLWCCRALPGSPLAGKHVLITSGPCREPVDDIRVLTTRSTGRMGRELALQAFRLGAEVTVVHAGTIPCVRNITIETAGEMHDAVHRICAERIPDIYISAAAISDYAPEPYRGKLRSGQTLSIPLHPLPKLIDEVCRRYNTSVIAFKVGEEGEEGAAPLIAKGADLVVINGPESMGSDTTDAIISGAGGREQIRGTKRELAARIWERIGTLLLPQG